MTLRCHLFGHRRSASRASFDDLNRCWVSDCKRCHAVLVRERPGQWCEAPLELPPILSRSQRGRRRPYVIIRQRADIAIHEACLSFSETVGAA